MTDLRQAAEMALEALAWGEVEDAKEHLSQALAQPLCQTGSQCVGGKCPECEREWVGLTDGEKKYLRALGYVGIDDIEDRLKRMNT